MQSLVAVQRIVRFAHNRHSILPQLTNILLLSHEKIFEQAEYAMQSGADSFCIVCAYKAPPEDDFEHICESIKIIRNKLKIDVNVSLGFMTLERAKRLKNLGVKRYNHNLETSRSLFNKICTTHSYEDRINTAKIIKEVGLELCCGGIIGLGETIEQRVELGIALSELQPDEVPINLLIGREVLHFTTINTWQKKK